MYICLKESRQTCLHIYTIVNGIWLKALKHLQIEGFPTGSSPTKPCPGSPLGYIKTLKIATIKVYNMLFENQHQPKNLLYDNLFQQSYIFSTCNQWEQWSCHQQVDQPRVQTSRNPQLYGYTSKTWSVNIYNPVLNGSDELLWK